MHKTLALLLALWVAPALAQTAKDTPEPPPAQESSPAPADDATEPAPPPASAAPDRNPSDYEASEQISEDLSVSFPADI